MQSGPGSEEEAAELRPPASQPSAEAGARDLEDCCRPHRNTPPAQLHAPSPSLPRPRPGGRAAGGQSARGGCGAAAWRSSCKAKPTTVSPRCRGVRVRVRAEAENDPRTSVGATKAMIGEVRMATSVLGFFVVLKGTRTGPVGHWPRAWDSGAPAAWESRELLRRRH